MRVNFIIPTLVNAYQYKLLRSLLNDEASETMRTLLRIGELSLDFDFPRARELYESLRGKLDPDLERLLELNFRDLMAGDAHAIFSELLYSMNIQWTQGQMVDFLGRAYRFNEAFFKYVFAVKEFGEPINIFNPIFEEDKIQLRLRRKHKINAGNIIFSVEQFIRREHGKDRALIRAMDQLSGPMMKKVIELRHNSIVGHGFKPASEAQLRTIIQDPADLLVLMKGALETVGIRVYDSKYRRLNEQILKEVRGDEFTTR